MRTKDVSRIFSSSSLIKLAEGDDSFFVMVLNSLNIPIDEETTVSEVLESIFNLLIKEYRNEYVFKSLITKKILLGRHSVKTSTQINEFRVGKCVADSVIINGLSNCFEIKTEFDSMNRLNQQLAEYAKVFDKVSVVTSPKHVDYVLNSTPKHIGVIELSERLSFSTKRKAILLPDDIFDASYVCSSLRTVELKSLAESLSGNEIFSNNIELREICSSLIQTYEPAKVKYYFKKVLKKSRSINPDLIEKWPACLSNALIEYKFRKMDVERLNDVLTQPVLEGKLNVLSSSESKAI